METDKTKLPELVRARGQLRRLFNRAASNISSDTDYCYIQNLQGKIITMDKDIQEQLLSTVNDDELEKEYDACEIYHLKWLSIKSNFDSKVKTTDSQDSTNNEKKHLNLPKLEFIKFNGDPTRWLPFWGQFRKIHEDKNLHDSDKFQYLLQAMEEGSNARNLVESFPPVSENYEKAIEHLRDRFAKKEILIEIYIRELLKLVISKIVIQLAIYTIS